MNYRLTNYCRCVYEVLAEKIMEWYECLRFKLCNKEEQFSRLNEVYRIKEYYMDEDFVKDFIKARKKSVGPGGYRITVTVDRKPSDKEIIGEVLLMRKKRIIERATLITRPEIPEKERLIYWKIENSSNRQS